jgi:peptidoglycan/LPS O-acetylase OafA/YrhL
MGSWGPVYQVRSCFFYLALGTAAFPLIRIAIERFSLPSLLLTSVICFALLTVLSLAGQGGTNFVNPAAPLAGIAAALALAAAADRLNIPLLATLGRLSLPIYVIHVIVASATRTALIKFAGTQSVPLHLIAGTLAAVSVPALIGLAAERLRLRFLFTAK